MLASYFGPALLPNLMGLRNHGRVRQLVVFLKLVDFSSSCSRRRFVSRTSAIRLQDGTVRPSIVRMIELRFHAARER
jgi:hypothetical protein